MANKDCVTPTSLNRDRNDTERYETHLDTLKTLAAHSASLHVSAEHQLM